MVNRRHVLAEDMTSNINIDGHGAGTRVCKGLVHFTTPMPVFCMQVAYIIHVGV